jgi:apolipoprotein N-acyltransferase
LTPAAFARRLADPVVLAWGWRRLVLAALAGAAASLALPPLGATPLLAGAFTALVWLLDGAADARGRGFAAVCAAFVVGWSFGFGYFAAGLWWIGEAFLHEPDLFGWFLPLGVVGLPAYLAAFVGLGAALARLAWSPSPWRVAALAAGVGIGEWLRGVLFTGFPWNAFGYAATAADATMQAASLVGVEGLTPLVVFCAAAPAVLADPARLRGRFAVLGLAAGLVAAGAAFGAARLAAATDATVVGVTLRIVQPNLTQRERHDPARRTEIVERYLRLSATPPAPGAAAATHLLWPESALPGSIERADVVFGALPRLLGPDAVLVAGFLRRDESGSGRVFNSLYVIDREARVLDRYDKTHLVPFGEYLPFADVAAAIGLEPLTRVLAFVPGTARRPIETPRAPPFGPLVCYEIIFPVEVAGEGPRPGWFVNLSDDSWFGDTLGPRQHLHQARTRAVEEGLPLVRATTTGVSAVIDGHGRVRAALPLGTEGALDAALPAALEPTIYAALRRWTLVALVLAFLAIAFAARISFYRSTM